MTIKAQPITKTAFAPFGDLINIDGDADKIINAGFCERYHDRAKLDFGPAGRAGISLFNAQPRALPYELDLLERHPEGSQAFIPMYEDDWLVTVATDRKGQPDQIHAFVVSPRNIINFHRGTWHGVLTPLSAPGVFAVVDRIGHTPNLEEFVLPNPVTIVT